MHVDAHNRYGNRPSLQYFFLDAESTDLVIAPAVAGVKGWCRIVIRESATGRRLVDSRVAPRDVVRIKMAELPDLATAEIGLVHADVEDGSPEVQFAPFPSEYSGTVHAVNPKEWGVDRECLVLLQDPATSMTYMARKVDPGGEVQWIHRASDPQSLNLSFREIAEPDQSSGRIIGNAHRWVVPKLRPAHQISSVTESGLMSITTHGDVTLAPGVRARHGRGPHVTTGYIGAWSGREPIVEALLFVLGRQYQEFMPYVRATTVRPGAAIYLGSPQSGWGHFLTQGLSRVWFALRNPDIPVVWDSARLQPYQNEVLRLLGMKNEQVFLSEPTKFEKMYFPRPGIAIGDYVSKDFVTEIGRVVAAPTVQGKKLLLSRSRLDHNRKRPVDPLDVLAKNHGFEIFHPENYSISEQLAEMSSAEVVLGIEGSAFHSPLLLQGPVKTRFVALTRHRAGGGVFEHVRRAKPLDYQTLNFLRGGTAGGFRGELEFDYQRLESAMSETEGFAVNLEALEPYREQPVAIGTPAATLSRYAQIRPTPTESAIMKTHLAVLRKDFQDALKNIGSAM